MGTTKPQPIKNVDLKLDSAEILNSVRNTASPNYQREVPIVGKANLGDIQAVGTIFQINPAYANEAINTLVNRIGRVYIIARTYMHNWGDIKKGFLEFGSNVESVYVGVAKAIVYDIEDSETTVFKRYKSETYSVVNYLNSEVNYPITIEEEQLRRAFLTYDGLSDLICGLIQSAYNAAHYDEFIAMKYLLQQAYINGIIQKMSIPELTNKENIETMLTELKAISNDMTFYRKKYNAYGALTFTRKTDQLFIADVRTNAAADVNVFAQTFNVDYAQYMGIQKMVDTFGENDNERLAILFAKDKDYQPLTQENYAELAKVKAMLIDRNFLMVVDNLFTLGDIYNPKGLYYNNFLHKWTTYGIVPFAQAVAFTTEDTSVTSVTVTPSTATVAKGATQQFEATVTGTGNPGELVLWEVSGTGDSEISHDGLLTVDKNEPDTSLTVKATSLQDPNVSGTATVTVS